MRPSPLPHHRTCGFLASGGWHRWTSPQRVHDVPHERQIVSQHFHSQPSARALPSRPRSGRLPESTGKFPSRGRLSDDLSGGIGKARSPVASLSLCAFGPSLQPLSRPSSLLWLLLTSACLSAGRSPRVRCMDSRAAPPDSTQCAFRRRSDFVFPSTLIARTWPRCPFLFVRSSLRFTLLPARRSPAAPWASLRLSSLLPAASSQAASPCPCRAH